MPQVKDVAMARTTATTNRQTPTKRLVLREAVDSISKGLAARSKSSTSSSRPPSRLTSLSSIGSSEPRQEPLEPPVPPSKVVLVPVLPVLPRPTPSAVDERSSLPVGGRLIHYWQDWRDMGASRKIVRWLRFGYPLPFHKNVRGLNITPPLKLFPPPELVTHYPEPAKQAQLLAMLDELVQKKAIREIDHNVPVHFSRVFLVPKMNGKQRLVVDLSILNQWLLCPHFKMDHAQVIRGSLVPLMWATSIDLSDAYLHIPMHPENWKYLVFQVGDKRYQFMVLPFGLNTAPRVFSEVMKALKRWGRALGLVLFQYLDDWLQLNLDMALLQHQTLNLLRQAATLGLIVNHEKSEVIPQQKIVFLGDMLDFQSGMIFPTKIRFQAICAKIELITNRPTAQFYMVHSLLGLLAATEKIVPYGRLHFRVLQTFCRFHMHRKVRRFHKVVVSSSVLKDLLWWSDPIHVFRGLPMTPPVPDFQIQTDASTTGWGINFRNQIISGTWNQQDQLLHINLLEMKTVLIAFERLQNHLQDRCVLFLIDNQTVVSYLQKQGDTRSVALMSLMTND